MAASILSTVSEKEVVIVRERVNSDGFCEVLNEKNEYEEVKKDSGLQVELPAGMLEIEDDYIVTSSDIKSTW